MEFKAKLNQKKKKKTEKLKNLKNLKNMKFIRRKSRIKNYSSIIILYFNKNKKQLSYLSKKKNN